MDFEAIDRALKEHFETVTPEEFRNNLQRACPYLFDPNHSNEKSHITSSKLEGDYILKKMDFEAIDRALKEHFEAVTPEEFRNNLQRACPHLFDPNHSNEEPHTTGELEKDYTSEKWEEIASEPPLGGPLPKNQHEKVNQGLLLEQELTMLNPLGILAAEDAPMTSNRVLPGSMATQKKSWRPLVIVGGLLIVGASASYGIYSSIVKESSFCFGSRSCSVNSTNNDKREKKPKTIEQYKIVGSSLLYPYMEVTDKSGRRAKINVILLSSAYRWDIGSDKLLVDSREKDKKIRKQKAISISSLANHLRKDKIPEIIQQEGSINRVIAIGTASCEGDDIVEEQNRAKSRAVSVAKIVENELLDVAHYSIVNLGQFNGGKCDIVPEKTSWQRAIILLGVRQDQKGINLEQAVRERLLRIVDLDEYTLGSEEKFKILNTPFDL
jgi:hypothetical protein